MQLFYSQTIDDDMITLSQEESAHAVRVLRKQIGDTLNVIDGKGVLYSAEIVEIDKRECRLKIFSKIADYASRGYKLHIAIAPTKSIDRYEWFLEKATELGCDRFTPLLCDHSERKIIKDERSEKIVIGAVKQSLKAAIPHLDSMTPFKEFVKQDFGDYRKFVAHCDDSPEKVLLRDEIEKGANILVLIGPEGDFSPQEVAMCRENGFVEVSLGESRLRSETAGVFAATLTNINNQ
ncbi:MAG: 16S rRNA (uracil(1498)-N(3))-methyltransferase [Rikenellaceae bacterium]